MPPSRSAPADVVVAGAGIAGATLALSLKHALGDGLSVVLADPALPEGAGRARSFRALAVAPDARHTLDELGLWPGLRGGAQPIRSMVITDSRPDAQPNPVFLTFEGGRDRAGGTTPLAHMILADDLRARLLQACAASGVMFDPVQVTAFVESEHGLTVFLSDGRRQRTRLLAAADGGRSRLRHAARIQTFGTSYPQAAIVATLGHTLDHDGRAVQHFLPAGPIALLPLRAEDGSGRRTSIVWTERIAEAHALAALPAEAFVAALEARIGGGLGEITLEDRPRAHPLGLSIARRLTVGRLALLGDAARTIHPLAGQGLNLGLRDAAALARRVVERAALGLDPGSPAVLAGYERDRRFHAAAMAAATDGLNRLFSNDSVALRAIRDLGLGLVDRAPAAKRMFVQQATGRALRRQLGE